ncbi:MAG: DUF262 domain-containing protein [Candidatus Cloacimonetes bacterium]|nr:DUF262 domain-containing protein [Candidatus Cloacimonadota bacterium]
MEWKLNAYSISEIWEWTKKHSLEISPDYQRREVWSTPARIALIDTILRNIPMPKIYSQSMYNENKDKVYRIIVDGQQRISTILMFLRDNLQLRVPYIASEYNKFYFRDLPDDIKNKFLNYQLDFNDILNPSKEEVRDLYARVNKYTVQLNKQELRRADFPGEFLTLAEELSRLYFFEESRFFSRGQYKRMLDIEYISELICLLLEGEQDKKVKLDEFCEKYTIFPQGKSDVKKNFENIIKDIETIFSIGKPLADTRFKQKSDFYSLFAGISEFKTKNKVINQDKLTSVRESLNEIDELIEPHSAIDEYREYAIHCISDANSIGSRRWRKNFLTNIIAPLYLTTEELESE